jgi:hypothetical protein
LKIPENMIIGWIRTYRPKKDDEIPGTV